MFGYNSYNNNNNKNNGKRPPCKFYPNCRKGNSCPFSHERGDSDGLQNVWNSETVASFTSQNAINPKSNQIKQDMRDFKDFASNPTLSSYGLAAPAVVNLIEGRDMSYEEVRLKYMEAVSTNKMAEFEKEMAARDKDMQFCINHMNNKEQHAVRYLQTCMSQVPSKKFIPKTVEENINEFMNSSTGFGGGFGTPSTSAFGTTNPFSSSSGGFGSSGFGQNNTASAFGQSNTNSAFGNTTSGFGSTPPANSGFGGSGFGKSGFGSSGFGSSASNTNSTSASAFGNSGFGSSGFGANSTSTNQPSGGFGSSGFGTRSTSSSQPSNGFGSSGFGSSGFGSSGFGSSGFGASKNTTGGFGSSGFGAANTSSGFGAANANIPSSGFGAASSGFGAANSGFGSSNTTAPSGFATTTTNSSLGFGSASQTAFGAPDTTTSPFASATNPPTKGILGISSQNEPKSLLGAITDSDVDERFKATKFELGRIPETAPPMAAVV
ncbi:hypothetical protein PSN45_000571 [Yamadazyma tenuis]|uniref:uncharacterized protein n=1 Tax=Candida tenuis TaxID=2315449 RepID=UPI0027A74818|nr:hypothetical protein PSN45_000571 [Yamadazyma tenuis]